MIIQTICIYYSIIIGISLFGTGVYLISTGSIEEVDNFWYSVLWIKPCLKSFYKILVS